MNSTVVYINIFAICCLGISFLKNHSKTKQSLFIAGKTFLRILPTVLVIILLIGLLMGFIPQTTISKLIGEQSGFGGIFFIALFGAILHIPSLISFPLAASLLENGASVSAVAAFITSLTMIGVVTLPLEIKELGKNFALFRNGISFIIAIIIALIIGSIL